MFRRIKKKVNKAIALLQYQIKDIKSFQPIFIVGCGHSGTSLLLRILNAHPDLLTIDFESYAFTKKRKKMQDLFLEWEKKRKIQNKKYWVEKTPIHVQHLPKIFKIFPKAKIIVMVRDGRDTAMSIKARSGSFQQGIERWIEDNEKALVYETDKRVYFLKLEDLTSNTKQNLEVLCEFLNIEYSDKMLNYHKKKYNYGGREIVDKKKLKEGENHEHYRTWQVNQPIFKDTTRWKKEANKEEKVIFQENENFFKLLEKYGYSK